ncbi:MAG: hypothetical protein JOZ78_20285 [Chroococcidiopsidaceae cyanobacterium CP_BM_ER_R8_30]|nr:hypothetical protein [Chroococcidiopsidaceae cyanobacterium CP_BM_ER_R8_30]
MPSQPDELAQSVESDAFNSECHSQEVEKIGQSIQEQTPQTKSRGKFIEESARSARHYAQVASLPCTSGAKARRASWWV